MSKLSRWRLGRKIAERALQGIDVRLVHITHGRSSWDPSKQMVSWNTKEGFTCLLHEVAHAALGHMAFPLVTVRIGLEAEAWVWAEEACYIWGLPFDYKKADRGFATYAAGVPGAARWRIAWRHR